MTTSAPRSTPAPLQVRDVTVAYDRASHPVLEGVDVAVPDRSFTAVIGPNACGKSTLLRTMARTLHPSQGQVVLQGRDISEYPAKEAARRMGLLPQTASAPDGIRVAELVARGRFPHQGLLRQWSAADKEAVREALAATRTAHLSARLLDELSGGQRQRVWVAMLLAQQTPIMLLDEPTTYLDIAHQYDLLDLLAELHEQGRTVVAVLHDLTQAARYATHLVVMKDGAVVTTGAPEQVLTADLVEEVFGLACVVAPDPVTGTPVVYPRTRRSTPRPQGAQRDPQPA